MMLCGFDWPAGRSKQVAYLDERDHIREMFVREGELWQEHDLTAKINAPKASDKSPLAGFSWMAGGTKQNRLHGSQPTHSRTAYRRQCPMGMR